MSLDVYLRMPGHKQPMRENRIFVRRDGQTVEISREEWDALYPGQEPCTVSDIEESHKVFQSNITHNLGRMADAVKIGDGKLDFETLYDVLWRPDEHGITHARQLIAPIEQGITILALNRRAYEAYNPDNGWGSYAVFLPWLQDYLEACREWPDAEVSVWR